MEKVIFAEEAATVHILIGESEKDESGKIVYEPHESRVMKPGETLTLNEVPSYLREAVEKGEAPGLTLLTPTQAKKLNEQAAKIRAVASAQNPNTNILPSLDTDDYDPDELPVLHAPEVEAGIGYALEE